MVTWFSAASDCDFKIGMLCGESHAARCRLGKDPLCVYPLVMTNIAIENGHRNSRFSH